MDAKPMYSNAFALAGRTSSPRSTQGVALGYALVAPPGRALNFCVPPIVFLYDMSGRALNPCASPIDYMASTTRPVSFSVEDI